MMADGDKRKLKQSKKDPNDKELLHCSFCGNNQKDVRKLIAGPTAFICDECVGLCNDIIREEIPEGKDPADLQGTYIHELLEKHFTPLKLDALASCSHGFPGDLCQSIELAINSWLEDKEIRFKFVGIGERNYGTRHEATIADLWEHQVYPHYVGPTQYELVNVEDDLNTKYLKNGLWLCVQEAQPFAIFFQYRPQRKAHSASVYLEVVASIGTSWKFIDGVFSAVKLVSKSRKNKSH